MVDFNTARTTKMITDLNTNAIEQNGSAETEMVNLLRAIMI